LSRKAQIFFPEFNIRLYDKNSESDYFFFPPPKSEYFFQQHWESESLYINMIKTFEPFGSSYLGQANELSKMEQKNGSL
jgi:hypothetical protein